MQKWASFEVSKKQTKLHYLPSVSNGNFMAIDNSWLLGFSFLFLLLLSQVSDNDLNAKSSWLLMMLFGVSFGSCGWISCCWVACFIVFANFCVLFEGSASLLFSLVLPFLLFFLMLSFFFCCSCLHVCYFFFLFVLLFDPQWKNYFFIVIL